MTARSPARQLSTADERRETVLRTAVRAFAARGYYGTPTVDIAKQAGISQSYLYRLFPAKEDLFIAVVRRCFQLARESFAEGVAKAASAAPEDVLSAMGDAYARLVEYVRAASGGGDADIQLFFARGTLCHLLVAIGALSVDARWAHTLNEGIRHY